MNRVGIEKINIYGASLYLDQRELAQARGLDPEKVVSDFLINSRSLNPPSEDAVTMGANAAKPNLEGGTATVPADAGPPPVRGPGRRSAGPADGGMTDTDHELPLADAPHQFPVLAEELRFTGAKWSVWSETVDIDGHVVVRDVLRHPGAVAVAAVDDEEFLQVDVGIRNPARTAAAAAAGREAQTDRENHRQIGQDAPTHETDSSLPRGRLRAGLMGKEPLAEERSPNIFCYVSTVRR